MPKHSVIKRHFIAALVGAALAIPFVAVASNPPPYPLGMRKCCESGSTQCWLCPTYNCCVTTCTLAKSNNPSGPCLLINCEDQCAAIHGF